LHDAFAVQILNEVDDLLREAEALRANLDAAGEDLSLNAATRR
jgi:hypothetical protein